MTPPPNDSVQAPAGRAPGFPASVPECADAILDRIGPHIRLGVPLGLGKPVQLVNELYRRAAADRRIDLEIYTALSLAPPSWGSELERRLVEPLGERLFGGCPVLDYVGDRNRGELPDNVRVIEFYLVPGTLLGNGPAQRDHISSNYTHVVRDVAERGLNVLAQLVGARDGPDGPSYSLSCNPDLSLETMEALDRRRREGEPVAVVGQVNRQLPYLFGDAEVAPAAFDWIVDDPALEFPPYGPPNEPVGDDDAMIGLYASALVPDGGTLQVGIGSMGDAVSRMLIVRHEHNGTYRELLGKSGADETTRQAIDDLGGTEPFERGLFGCSEMLVEGMLELYRAGILKRRAHPHTGLQELTDAGDLDGKEPPEAFDALVEGGHLPSRLDEAEVAALREAGVLAADVELVDGMLVRPERRPVEADLGNGRCTDAIRSDFLADRLGDGHVAHSAFFLGPRAFYDRLRELGDDERRLFRMTRVGWVNQLGEERALQVAQRRRARFLNETMMVTGLGAAVSDGLEDGRVVSGVGGQYNFVAMAHELPGARSAVMLSSTRRSGDGTLESNIRWSYGHATIPRHLKDLVVTEYGVADLRGRTDREVCAALVGVMDARFQEGFVEQAKKARKLERSYTIPDRHRTNRPARIRDAVSGACTPEVCPRFPFGSDLSAEEVQLARALRAVGAAVKARRIPRPRELRAALSPPESARPYLERMGLERPKGVRERGLRAAVAWGLALTATI